MTYVAITVCFFVEYLPGDGRKEPKHVAALPHVCILLYLIVMQLVEYIYIYIDSDLSYLTVHE